MTQVRLERCELTYEGAFARPAFAVVDSPGRLCDLLLQALSAFGCTSADLFIEDGEPVDRGVTCEVDELEARVTIHGDRLEIHCANCSAEVIPGLNVVLTSVWSALARLGEAAPITHSFLFEADMQIVGPPYREVLNRLATAPASFPPDTETAIGYYLPADAGKNYRESSLVLNRSAARERGLQVNATLVYGAVLHGDAVLTAKDRLRELLQNLELVLIEE
jgi:hypothetical protein